MLKIKELSQVIDMAQTNVFDQDLYYDRQHKTLIFWFMDTDMEEPDQDNEDLLLISVEPFGRDMFREFFETIPNLTIREMLKDRFHGPKKYRKVKDLFPRYHLLDAFYRFKDQYQLAIAKSWCEKNKIAYLDTDGKVVTFKF